MRRDEIIRIRVTGPEKERYKRVAEDRGQDMSDFAREALNLACAQQEHGSATRQKISTNDVKIPEPTSGGLRLSDGLQIGQKKTYSPDPK